MSLRETIIKKLQQATCDKPELNRQTLKIQKSLKEVQKVLNGPRKPDKKK